MDVFEFDKCLLDRLEESMDVLSWKDGVMPASRVRMEWSYYIELQIEPAGWQGLWKIPRVICEELNLRFPTVVFGMVEQVLFKELKAIFLILAVQDEDVHLPERQEVSLEDLWPTKMQENSALNIERTADCIDRLRFFYSHVWMPWDNDNDDLNWVEKHLESRIRFCYDLKKKSMKRSLALHIKTLLTEARYIQQRREYLEIGLSDDEEEDVILDKTQITDLMRLHLRLAIIASEIGLLENPELRKMYEEIKFDEDKSLKHALDEKTDKRESIVYIVTKPITFDKQMQFMLLAAEFVGEEKVVQMCPSLQDVLNICNASDEIYLPAGLHSIKFLEYLNDDGKIIGLTKSTASASSIEAKKDDVIIMSPDDDSILLNFDGNFSLSNLTLDCRNIRSGIMVKNGKVVLKNCKIIGDGKSSTQQGIMCSGSSEILLYNCILENFSNGIIASDTSSVSLTNCEVKNCRIGIDVSSTSRLHFENCKISKSKKCGIYFESGSLNNKAEEKTILLSCLNDLSQYICGVMPWFGDCDFEDCCSNIFIMNEKEHGFPKTLECILSENNNSDSQKRVASAARKKLDDSDVIVLDDSIVEINYDTE